MNGDPIISLAANSYFTEAGNIAIFTCIGLVLIAGGLWVHNNKEAHSDTIPIMMFLLLLLAYIGTRIGYWVPATMTAPQGEAFNPVFVHWKWLMTMGCAAGCIYATTGLLDSIKQQNRWRKLGMVVGITSFAFLAALL